jgi:hypothetical protein
MHGGRSRRRAWIAGLLVGLAAARPAAAGRLALQISPACRYRAGRVDVTVDVANRGDEPAAEARVTARLGAAAVTAPLADPLAAGAQARATLDLGAAPQPAGVYTVVVEVRYADGNGYPFSALSFIPLVTADVTDDPPLAAAAGALTFWEAGSLRVTVSNRLPRAVDAEVRLVLPAGLDTPAAARRLSAPAGGPAPLEFPVTRAGARHRSRHLALVLFDGVDAGRHWSLAQPAVIRVERPPDPLTTWRGAGWATVVALLAAFALLQRGRRPDPS